MICGAIFDLDGTLLDSNGFWERAPEAWLAALGKRAKPGLGRAIFSMTLPVRQTISSRNTALRRRRRRSPPGSTPPWSAFTGRTSP